MIAVSATSEVWFRALCPDDAAAISAILYLHSLHQMMSEKAEECRNISLSDIETGEGKFLSMPLQWPDAIPT